jgi:hypothetical protein
VLIGAGIVLIVAATLTLSSAGYGTEVKREFSQRRSYDMIKPAVHKAMPRAVLLGLGGLVLILIGAQFRRGAEPGDQRDQAQG